MHRSYAITLISEIRTAVHKFIEKELEKRGVEGLVVSHGSILTVLYKSEGQLPMKDISRKIRRSKSTTTQLVNKLIKSGYVKKVTSPKDARVRNIVLTDKGRGIKDVYMEISKKLNEVFYQGLD